MHADKEAITKGHVSIQPASRTLGSASSGPIISHEYMEYLGGMQGGTLKTYASSQNADLLHIYKYLNDSSRAVKAFERFAEDHAEA